MIQQLFPQQLRPIGQIVRPSGSGGFRINGSERQIPNAPVINSRGFQLEAQGRGDIGKAVFEIGSAAQAFLNEGAKAESEFAVSAARHQMALAENDIAADLVNNEPDNTKWESKAEGLVKGYRERWVTKNLSPWARQQIEALDKSWGQSVVMKTKLSAAERSVSKLKEDYQARHTAAVESGDFESAATVRKEMQGRGFLSGAQSELGAVREKEAQKQFKGKAEAEAEKAEFDDAYAIAVEDPEGWKSDPQNAKPNFQEGRWKGKATLWTRLKNAADGRSAEIHAEQSDAITDGIVTSTIISEKTLDAAFPNLRPAVRAQHLANIGKMAAKKSDAERNGPEGMKEWVRQYRRAQAWTADSSKPEELASLIADVRFGVPDDLQGEVTQILHQKFGAKTDGKTPQRPEVQSAVTKALNDAFSIKARPTAQALDAAKAKLTEDGKAKLDTTKSKAAFEAAQAAHDKASEEIVFAQADVEGKMRQWYEQNPNATGEKAREEMARRLPEGTRSGFLKALKEVSSRDSATGLSSKLPDGLKPYAQDFMDAAKESGLDPRLIAAIAMHETGNGTSKAFKEKLNAMGISDSTGPIPQSSVRASILRQSLKLVDPSGPYAGKKTIDEIGAVYAPIGAENDPRGLNDRWASGVKKHFNSLHD